MHCRRNIREHVLHTLSEFMSVENQTISYQAACVAQQLRASHLDRPLKFTRITDDEACISIHPSKPHIFHGGSSKPHDIASHTSVPSPLPWTSNSSPSSNEPSGVPQFSSTQSFSQKLSILPTQRALPPSLRSQPQ
jgi:hypothetical protein